MYEKHEKRFRLMIYEINYEMFPGFLAQINKYNAKYKHFKSRKMR